MGLTVNCQMAKIFTVNHKKTQYFYRQPSNLSKPMLAIKCLKYPLLRTKRLS